MGGWCGIGMVLEKGMCISIYLYIYLSISVLKRERPKVPHISEKREEACRKVFIHERGGKERSWFFFFFFFFCSNSNKSYSCNILSW